MKFTGILLLLATSNAYLGAQNPASRNGYHLLSLLPLEKHLAYLRSSDLIFFLQPDEAPYHQSYLDVFEKNWTYSAVQVIDDYRELDSLWTDREHPHSFATITCATTNSQTDPTIITHFPYLTIWYPVYKSDGTVDHRKVNSVFRFPLLLDRKQVNVQQLMTEVYRFAHLLPPKSDVHYEMEPFYNWHPGYIGLYLRMASQALEQSELVLPYGPDQFDYQKSKRLRQMVLHVPDYALDKINGITMKLKENKLHETLFGAYPWKLKIDNPEEMYYLLSSEFGESDCLLYPQWSALSVVHIQSGELLYHDRYSARLKPQLHLSDIRHLIEKVSMN